MKKQAFIIGGALCTMLFIAGFWFFWESSFVADDHEIDRSGIENKSGRPVPDGLLEYYNPHYNFSLLYPENLVPAEYDEGNDALTITFEDVSREEIEGFQVFIVPFSENQITEERFRVDIPSGVRKEQQDIVIDGARGASFYSADDILGETAEVWILREGYLYEISTFREQASWLQDILATWKFQ